MPFSFRDKFRRLRRNGVDIPPHAGNSTMRSSPLSPPSRHAREKRTASSHQSVNAYTSERGSISTHRRSRHESSSEDSPSTRDRQECLQSDVKDSDQGTAFTRPSIDTPSKTNHRPLTPESSNYKPQSDKTHKRLVMDATNDQFAETSSLPRYNDVNHAAIVNRSGRLHFLPPHEEQERKLHLQHVVHERMLGHPSSLPVYNDVSGAVIVGHDGLPYFLSPQEEQERQLSLEQAVREKMLGLPRRTEFTWEQSRRAPALPAYSPAKDK